MARLWGLVWALLPFLASCHATTSTQYIAKYLDVKFHVVNNTAEELTFSGRFDLTNTGSESIQKGDWSLRFCFVRLFEPGKSTEPEGAVLGASGFTAFHINGCMYKLVPNDDFNALAAGAIVELPFNGEAWLVARTDAMPNWYVVNDRSPGEAQTITSTAGEEINYLAPLTKEDQYKRTSYDTYSPYTAPERYDKFPAEDLGSAPLPLLPQPVEIKTGSGKIDLSTKDWVVVAAPDLQLEAQYLADILETSVVTSPPASRYIQLDLKPDVAMPTQCQTPNDKGNEGYYLQIDANNDMVSIIGKSKPAIMHGSNSLINLMDDDTKEIAAADIRDCPRYEYRGMHIDAGRNFFPKDSMLKMIDVMSRYKLNKFHLHITDDEGWRLEIPGIEELTTVGASRCEDVSGDECILPQLGSSPLPVGSGTGFYTVQEYKDILKYAADRHIKVIPEFDMPGHGHAAINAMESRFRKYETSDPAKAAEYRLIDPTDNSEYLSVQYFTDNAIDPCLESTYTFIRKVAEEVQKMHADIQPLTVFNYGGDEVPGPAWKNSSACAKLKQENPDVPEDATSKQLKEYMVQRIANISTELGIVDIAAWEDGVIGDKEVPFDRSKMNSEAVYAYAWQNIWEWGVGNRAYKLANADYKVIIAHATHLYFDHPQEPDPEERGYYWATRFTDTRKTFSYMPDRVYDNMDVDRFGRPLDKDDICSSGGCTPLQKPDNIVGIQGHLWSETVRTPEHLYAMLFPRMLAVAERAWHRAPWEDVDKEEERNKQKIQDWENFANTLGHKELARLDQMGVTYHVRPPGIQLINGYDEISAKAEFPGLPISITTDGGKTFTDYHPGMSFCNHENVAGIVRSTDRSRQSLLSQDIEIPCGPS